MELPIKILTPQLPLRAFISSILFGVAPKKKLKLATLDFSAILNFSSNNLEFVVAGFVFGISKNVVIPPQTAARAPLFISSLCVRPGSLK